MDFRAFLHHGHRGSQEDNGRNGRKWQKMGCRGKMAGNGFPRVSRRGHRGGPEDHGQNGRKWQKKGCRGYLVGNGFPRVSRRGHRGGPVDNGRKWPKMVEKGGQEKNGRKRAEKFFALYAPWSLRWASRLRFFFRPLFLMKAKNYRLTKVSHDELWKLGSEGRLWTRGL